MPLLRLYKKGNKLVHATLVDSNTYNHFVQVLPDGQNVEAYFDLVDNSKSFSQLAMVHALIRKICIETGNDFSQIKTEIKKQAGLYLQNQSDDVYKSFADCSRDELSRAIFIAEEMCGHAGLPVL